MSNRRPSSRSQSGTKSKQSARGRASQPERSVTGVLFFFLIVFLILLVLLLGARLSSDQSVLLGIVLLALMVGVIAIWLVGRKRRYVTETVRVPGVRVSRVPAQVLPTSCSVSVTDLLQLTPGEFEDFVGAMLTATGQYSDVRRIGGAGDRGADLLAKDRFGRPFIVQCKRYQPARKVNAGEMRDFLGAKGIYGADECLFVTTSTFTEAARANMVHFQHSVFLWDGPKLTQLVTEYWHALPIHWQQFIQRQQINAD